MIGRKTRWGSVVVEDENHCEFIHLRNFLTRTHLQDLVETTSMVHYETFRSNQLMALKGSVSAAASSNEPNNSPIPQKSFPPFA